MSKPTLIAMRGLPRSGKSTIVAELSLKLGAPIVRRDAIRLALHGMRFKADAEPMVKAMSIYMIRALFLSGHKIVICDETNIGREARDSVKDPSWNTYFYEVSTTPEVCIERAIATNQPDLVPVIAGMAKRLHPLDANEKIYTP